VQDRARAKVADFTQEAETARATGKAQPAQLSFSHDEMTALIGEWGRQGHWFGLVQDLQVTFVPGGMTLTGRLQTAGLEFQFRLDINIKIENRERTAEVVQAQIGQLIVPGFVRGILLGLAMRTLDAGLPRVPMVIESLLVGEGELLISGEVLP